VPIYEYACKECDHRLDALQKMSEDPLTDCPACGKAALRRLISAPRFRLKGAGWYETDFKKDNQRNIAKGDSEAPSDKKSEKKSESKSGSGNGKSSTGATSDKKSTANAAKKSTATKSAE